MSSMLTDARRVGHRNRVRLLLLAVVTACGTTAGINDGGADGSTDSPTDTTVGLDGGADDAADALSDVGDAGVETSIVLALECADPTQCEAGAPVCCATLSFGDCVLAEVSAACTTSAACPTTLQPFCATTETVQLCGQSSECTEPGYDHCCTFDITGRSNSLVLCASQAMAASVHASCTP